MNASVTELQWIVDVYNFVYASLLLTAGTLADLYGRRRIFALGIALFTLGTVVCGLAPDVPTLVAGRAVAGLGAALEMSASLAILTIAYPDTKERTRALGIWASCYGIAIVIGPTAGGALVDASGWRSIFLLIIPFCLVTLALVMTVVPESSNPQGRRLDLPGQALAIASLGSLSLAAIEGPRWGWASTGSVAAFSLSIVAAALFLRRQAGATDAVVPLPMLRHRVFAACLAVATAANFGAYAMLFLTPLYFQTARGASALDAAVLLLPMSLSYALTSQLSGRIANNLGPRVPMTAGMGLMGVGLLMLALIPLNDSLVLIESGLLVIGLRARSLCRTNECGGSGQRAGSPIRHRIRSHQYRPHDRRNARRSGARRDVCNACSGWPRHAGPRDRLFRLWYRRTDRSGRGVRVHPLQLIAPAGAMRMQSLNWRGAPPMR